MIARQRSSSLLTSIRSLVALVCVAVGAALFAISFQSTLALFYAVVYYRTNVVEAIVSLP